MVSNKIKSDHHTVIHLLHASTDGDYETSSEGAIRNMQGKQTKGTVSKNSVKLVSVYNYDVENPVHMGKETSDDESDNQAATFASSTVLARSKSMPLFKRVRSLAKNKQEEAVAQTSESSLACQKKMEMIVDEIDPRSSSGSNDTNTSSNSSRMDAIDKSYESAKLESSSVLSELQVIMQRRITETPSYFS